MKGSASTSFIRQKWKKVCQPDSSLQGCKATMTTGSHDRKLNLLNVAGGKTNEWEVLGAT